MDRWCYGMIEGTTVENFQCNCGGWNCRHQLVPIADAVVPASLREKFAKAAKETPKPEEKTPETPKKAVDLAPYQEQISAIEQYIADHPKSAKIKGYLADIQGAAAQGNETDLQALLQAAKKDIAKFNASKNAVAKKKAAIEQAKQDELTKAQAAQMQAAQAYMQGLIIKYGSLIAFDDLFAQAADAVSAGDSAKVYDIADQIDKLAQSINDLTDITKPMQWAKDYTYDELAGADKYVSGHMNTWMSKGKTGQQLVQAIDDEINKYLNPSHKTYNIVKEALEKKKTELQIQIAKDEFWKKKVQITDYIQAHPKAGKVIDCFYKMQAAEKASDMDAANGYADNALEIIKKNEGVAAYLKKKKAGQKSNDTTKLVDLTQAQEAAYAPEDEHLRKVLGKTIDDFIRILNNYLPKEKALIDKLTKAKGADIMAGLDAVNEAKNALKNILPAGERLNNRYWCSAEESELDYYLSITTAGQYSKERKRKAAIFEDDLSAFEYTYQYTNFRDTWKNATTDQKEANESYTRASGSITKLLRGIKGWYESDSFYANKSEREANALTELIQQTTCQHDIFLKRDEKHEFCSYRWRVKFEDYIDRMQDLVGKEGVDESFMSCGNNKNTIFSGTGRVDTELRIFCPKGTQMMPEEPQGHYSHYGKKWNGNSKTKDFNENEIVLQRGTKLRITAARYDKKKHYYYIACEVISQNPRPFHIEYTAGQGYKAVYD